MRFGKECYAEINQKLNDKFEQQQVLIAAHRGSWAGNIIQNSVGAYKAALAMGADMVETDMSMTTDGVIYSFHDRSEPRVFGVAQNIKTMTSTQVESYLTKNSLAEPCSRRVNRLTEVLDALNHGELINIDRSWFWFEPVLRILDQYPNVVSQAIIKAPLSARHVLETLNAHSIKYMFMPICYSLKDIEDALSYPELNVVGAELIAFTPQDELFGEEAVRFCHERSLYTWVNAITLGDVTTKALYGCVDDDISILQDPALGWGKLIDMGFDVLQTDWPAILRDYRRAKLSI